MRAFFREKKALRRICQGQNEAASDIRTDRLLSANDENAAE